MTLLNPLLFHSRSKGVKIQEKRVWILPELEYVLDSYSFLLYCLWENRLFLEEMKVVSGISFVVLGFTLSVALPLFVVAEEDCGGF